MSCLRSYMEEYSQQVDQSVEKPSFIQRRLVHPLINQLKQGATPEKLAQSMAIGAMIGIIPILGTTTTLCALAAIAFRLNHIAIQAVNWLIYPLQLILIIPFLKMGNMIFGMDTMALSLAEITHKFETDFWGSFQQFGWLALRGLVAWILIAVPMAYLISKVITPALCRLANKTKSEAVAM